MRITNVLILSFIVGLFVSQLLVSIESKEFHYDSYGVDINKSQVPKTYLFELDTNLSVVIDPTLEVNTLSFCENDYFCFESNVIDFFIPKCRVALNQKWSKNDINYFVKEERDVSFFGVNQKVLTIEAKFTGDFAEGSVIRVFYFSLTEGLLGFSERMAGETKYETYWLREDRGVGASRK